MNFSTRSEYSELVSYADRSIEAARRMRGFYSYYPEARLNLREDVIKLGQTTAKTFIALYDDQKADTADLTELQHRYLQKYDSSFFLSSRGNTNDHSGIRLLCIIDYLFKTQNSQELLEATHAQFMTPNLQPDLIKNDRSLVFSPLSSDFLGACIIRDIIASSFGTTFQLEPFFWDAQISGNTFYMRPNNETISRAFVYMDFDSNLYRTRSVMEKELDPVYASKFIKLQRVP